MNRSARRRRNRTENKGGQLVDHETDSWISVRIHATDSTNLTIEKPLVISVNDLVEATDQGVTISDASGQRWRLDPMTIEFDSDVAVMMPTRFRANASCLRRVE